MLHYLLKCVCVFWYENIPFPSVFGKVSFIYLQSETILFSKGKLGWEANSANNSFRIKSSQQLHNSLSCRTNRTLETYNSKCSVLSSRYLSCLPSVARLVQLSRSSWLACRSRLEDPGRLCVLPFLAWEEFQEVRGKDRGVMGEWGPWNNPIFL